MVNAKSLPALLPVLDFLCANCKAPTDDEVCSECTDAENARIFAADDDGEICGCPCGTECGK